MTDSRRQRSGPQRTLTKALVVLIAALLLVGVLGYTPGGFAVQAAPMIVLLALGPARRGWLRLSALAMFAFWLLIMVLIWLYLLGLANVIMWDLAPIEIVATVVIGFASLAGIVAAVRATEPSRWSVRLAAFGVAFLLQVGAAWLSVQRFLC